MRLLADVEFAQMMSEFDQAEEWMMTQLQAPGPAVAGKRVIGMERHNLAELQAVERLVSDIGIERFEMEAQRLARLHTIDLQAPMQSLVHSTHPSLLGMGRERFDVLRRICDQLVEREPALLEHPSYCCRDTQRVGLPLTLWLDLVRFARAHFDPAGQDADFLVAKLKEGLSSEQAFEALIARKRAGS